MLCLLVQVKVATQIAKVNHAISWGRYGGQAIAAYWGLTPQYATALSHIGGTLTGGASVGTMLSSIGKPFSRMAHGAASFASPEFVSMTNATVTGIAQFAAPLWVPVADSIESMDYTTDDHGLFLHSIWMVPVIISLGAKAIGKATTGTTSPGHFV